jgi:hypothetical protein
MLLTVCVALAGASVVAVAGVLAGLLMLGYAARQRTPSPPLSPVPNQYILKIQVNPFGTSDSPVRFHSV